MRARVVLALVLLVGTVLYVVHAVGFRPADRDDGIPVVSTWGELMAQPAFELPNGDRLRLGLETRLADQHGAALLYVLWECPARERGTSRIRITRGDSDQVVRVDGPRDGRAWLWLRQEGAVVGDTFRGANHPVSSPFTGNVRSNAFTVVVPDDS